MIPLFQQTTEISLALRDTLHPLFQKLPDGISEFTFANLFLFRKTHNYRITKSDGNVIIITGTDNNQPFFMSPFDLPQRNDLELLFKKFISMKCVSSSQAESLKQMGYIVTEDRDNYDYLYYRKDLSELSGRKFSKKRNQIKAFINNFNYRGEPLLEQHKQDALSILEQWRDGRDNPGDYIAAFEALELTEELQLCGGIYYADDTPVAYSLGEEIMQGKSFVIHFEKAVPGYKGLWQFVNQTFASILPEKYTYINREQDMGETGLRKAKLSYQPIDYIKKYRACLPDSHARFHKTNPDQIIP